MEVPQRVWVDSAFRRTRRSGIGRGEPNRTNPIRANRCRDMGSDVCGASASSRIRPGGIAGSIRCARVETAVPSIAGPAKQRFSDGKKSIRESVRRPPVRGQTLEAGARGARGGRCRDDREHAASSRNSIVEGRAPGGGARGSVCHALLVSVFGRLNREMIAIQPISRAMSQPVGLVVGQVHIGWRRWLADQATRWLLGAQVAWLFA